MKAFIPRLVSCLAMGLLSAASNGAPPAFLDAQQEYAAADKAEKARDWNEALLHYENIYDATPTVPRQRVELRRKFLALHPKVKPNADPALAGQWKVKVYVFRTLNMTQTIDGKECTIHNTYSDQQIEGIEKAMEGFAKDVWTHTLGSLRIVWKTEVIEEPLKKVGGWPDPSNCAPHFKDLKAGDCDCVMVYVNTEGVEPWDCWAGTFGCIPEVHGAMYIGFNDTNDGLSRDPRGEVQLHEWLHAVHMTIDDVQQYPKGLMVTSDCGGKCSGISGVKCWEGKPDEGAPGWTPWYYHLLDCHLTRKMWRELSVLHAGENCWMAGSARKFLFLGPFAAQGASDNYGLDTAFIKEQSALPKAGAQAGGRTWKIAAIEGRSLDFCQLFDETDNRAAYAAVEVSASKAIEAEVRVGSDDGCKLWHDGKLILTEPALRAAEADSNSVAVQLKEGRNLFLMKVGNANGGWAAIFRVCDKDGNPIPGVTCALPGRQ